MWFRKKTTSLSPAANDAAIFDMPIDDAFKLKVAGRVVVVGVVAAGEIRPGMDLRIRTPETTIPVKVIALEAFHQPLKYAHVGDNVAALLDGVERDQVVPGSRLTGGGG